MTTTYKGVKRRAGTSRAVSPNGARAQAESAGNRSNVGVNYLIALVLYGATLEAVSVMFGTRTAWILMLVVTLAIAMRYRKLFDEANRLIQAAGGVTRQ